MKYLSGILCMTLFLSWSISWSQQEDYSKKDQNTKKAEKETFEYDSVDSNKKWDWTKARMGGNFAMSFYDGGLYIDVSPTFGYKLTKVVEVGAGFKTFFAKQNNFIYNGIVYSYSSLTYGPLAYARFTVWDGIFVMTQYEMANKDRYYIDSDHPEERINVHHLLLGGGYSQPIGSVGNLNISLAYEVIDNKESIYQYGTFGELPLMLNINVGFGIGR